MTDSNAPKANLTPCFGGRVHARNPIDPSIPLCKSSHYTTGRGRTVYTVTDAPVDCLNCGPDRG